MTVERADFDDLVTSSARRRRGTRTGGWREDLPARSGSKANAPDQILQRWTWKLAKAT
jgi:hypothetical protein